MCPRLKLRKHSPILLIRIGRVAGPDRTALVNDNVAIVLDSEDAVLGPSRVGVPDAVVATSALAPRS